MAGHLFNTLEDIFHLDSTDFSDKPEENPMTDFEMAIWNEYGKAWSNRNLLDTEYPPEDVCAICKGCGNFNKHDGETGECFKDRMEGECYHRVFDTDQFGAEVAAILETPPV